MSSVIGYMCKCVCVCAVSALYCVHYVDVGGRCQPTGPVVQHLDYTHARTSHAEVMHIWPSLCVRSAYYMVIIDRSMGRIRSAAAAVGLAV